MTDDGGSEALADEFLLILETLSLFNKVRKIWEGDKEQFAKILFLKDGPLQFRAHYTKLTDRIRNFFEFAKKSGVQVFMVGQEKSGLFCDHLYLVGRDAQNNSYFVPDNKYIQKDIHQIPNMPPYGKWGNYGVKVFVSFSPKEQMVLTIPTGLYKNNPKFEHLIGGSQILNTIKKMRSSRYLGGIVPISIAHGLASLSQNPSGPILDRFSKNEFSN